MIAYFALGLSIFNTLLWVVLALGIRKVFIKMLPMFSMMGIGAGISDKQNLTPAPNFDKIQVPPLIEGAESEK